MTEGTTSADTAFQVADLLRTEGPWEVYAQRTRRYEVHLNGRAVEMVRGPIRLEGYGLRLFRFRDGVSHVGFQASTDLSEDGVREASHDAETLAHSSSFPAKKVELPGTAPGGAAETEIRDPTLWARPLESLQEYVETLLGEFDPKKGATPSFGSVRASLIETSIANSAGLRAAYPHTVVEFELAVKSEGGPEGAPPGEYWVTESFRRLDRASLPHDVAEWSRFAQDARRAKPTPLGDLPVVLPPSVLSGILPTVVGWRCTGAARLREVAPAGGTKWAAEEVNITDDGLVPWALGSTPIDDEGSPQRRRQMLVGGVVSELLYDVSHAGAFDTRSTGNAFRGRVVSFQDWRRFLHAPVICSTTLSVAPGTGGTDEELIQGVQDGIWLQQLGWAIPNPLSGAFGGEVRIGYRIHQGKLAEPVRGGTIGGLVMAPPGTPSLLSGVVAVGSHPTLAEGVLSPTLVAKNLTVAGA